MALGIGAIVGLCFAAGLYYLYQRSRDNQVIQARSQAQAQAGGVVVNSGAGGGSASLQPLMLGGTGRRSGSISVSLNLG